uniref:protein HEG homolog 1-like n=1 Tax=Myxine glutinosa TaxID=7769 RepID=UPI00358E5B86
MTTGNTAVVTSGNASTTERKTDSTFTTPAVQTCSVDSCPAQAVCHMNQQKSAYWCECPVGYNSIDGGDCISVKAFTSMLHWDDIFTSQMNDKTSKDFKRIENETKTEFNNVYWNISGYIGVEVLQISKGSVKVLTSCMFNKESKMNDALFNNLLGQINDSSIEQYNICDLDTCDKQTASCLSKDGIISCNCNDGHVPSKYSQWSCLACDPGKKAANNKCEACPFGYSGVNCNDASLLEVVIISVVLGVIILVLIILIIVGCCKKKQTLENPYSKEVWQRYEEFSNHSPVVIPRARSKSQQNNSLLMDGGKPSRNQHFSNPSFKPDCD